MVIMSNWSDRQAWFRADSSFATKCMVGRASEESRTHAKAIVTTNTTSSAIWPVGGGSRWSSTSFNRISALSEIDVAVLDLNVKEDRSSLGCLPIITSNATTPKL